MKLCMGCAGVLLRIRLSLISEMKEVYWEIISAIWYIYTILFPIYLSYTDSSV